MPFGSPEGLKALARWMQEIAANLDEEMYICTACNFRVYPPRAEPPQAGKPPAACPHCKMTGTVVLLESPEGFRAAGRRDEMIETAYRQWQQETGRSAASSPLQVQPPRDGPFGKK